jgi:hypothetical protein
LVQALARSETAKTEKGDKLDIIDVINKQSPEPSMQK